MQVFPTYTYLFTPYLKKPEEIDIPRVQEEKKRAIAWLNDGVVDSDKTQALNALKHANEQLFVSSFT